MSISNLDSTRFETSKRLLAQLVTEGLASGTIVTTELKTWLHLSSTTNRPGVEEQRGVKVRVRPDAAAHLSLGTSQVIRPEHLQPPACLEVTGGGKRRTWEELDPGSIFEFVYPWFQDIDRLQRKPTIVEELRNSAANQEKWLEIASELHEPNLDSSYLDWERTLIWGHPTHPFHRSLGAEPPLEPIEPPDIPGMLQPDIAFISIPRSDVIITGTFKNMLQPLLQALNIAAPSADRIIIPSLVRQEPAIRKRFPTAVPVHTLRGSLALSNYRTVVLNLDYKYQLKFALACKITSAIRTITPAAACSTPEISNMLIELLPKELWLYEDVASVVGSQESSEEAKHIGCILRLDLEPRARENGQALVIAAALAQGTIRDNTTYAEKIFGLDTLEKKKTWFREYASTLLGVMLPPVINHGIGLEPHAQNVVVRICMETRTLKGFAIRDLGGINLHLPTLHAQGYSLPSVKPGDWRGTTDIQEVWKMVHHPLIQSHLGQLIYALKLEGAGGWGIVREELLGVLKPEEGGMGREMCEFLLRERVNVKCFLRMKIADSYREYEKRDVPNALLS